MAKGKKLFKPGQMVKAISGQAAMVLEQRMYDRAREILREGRKAGRYFAPGCCHHPDYVTQVPVLFEDGTWDVMRSMNLKKQPDMAEEKGKAIHRIIEKNKLAQ
jgi:hypothetical protein